MCCMTGIVVRCVWVLCTRFNMQEVKENHGRLQNPRTLVRPHWMCWYLCVDWPWTSMSNQWKSCSFALFYVRQTAWCWGLYMFNIQHFDLWKTRLVTESVSMPAADDVLFSPLQGPAQNLTKELCVLCGTQCHKRSLMSRLIVAIWDMVGM